MTTIITTHGSNTATVHGRATHILFIILIMTFFGTGCQKTVVDKKLTAAVESNAGVDTAPTTTYKLYFKTLAQLSVARCGVAAAAAGNKILFAGGYTPINGDQEIPPTPSSRVDIFDATTLQRTTHELSVARYGIGAAALGNKIFFGGGWTSWGTYSNRVDIYDVSTNVWTTATLSQARGGIAVAATGSKVIFAGGINSQLYPTTYYSGIIDIYDVNTGGWSASWFAANRDPHAAAAGNDVAIEGIDPTDDFPKAHIYHTTTNSWTNMNLIYYGSTSHYFVPPMFAASAGSKMLFGFGGEYPISPIVNIIQSGTNINHQTFLSNPRVNAGTCTAGNFAFIAGGASVYTYFNQLPSNVINVYNAGLDAWTTSSLHTPVSRVQGASANNTVVFAGIKDGQFAYSEVQVYKLTDQPPIIPVP